MSKKHFDEYYNDLAKNYFDMVNVLAELEKSCGESMVTPEVIENYKKTLQPIKDSFLSVQYMKYLLDKPNKKSKQNRYEKLKSGVDKEKFVKDIENNKEKIGDLLK